MNNYDKLPNFKVLNSSTTPLQKLQDQQASHARESFKPLLDSYNQSIQSIVNMQKSQVDHTKQSYHPLA